MTASLLETTHYICTQNSTSIPLIAVCIYILGLHERSESAKERLQKLSSDRIERIYDECMDSQDMLLVLLDFV